MGGIGLRVRDLRTGDTEVVSFDDEAAATAWLRARPPLQQVTGTATAGLAHEVEQRLRAALRPLDAAEQEAERALDEAAAEAVRARNEQARQRDLAAAEAHRQAQAKADPNRPMEVHFRYGHPLQLADGTDPRSIPGEVEEAVLAWVTERNEWVKDRGQIVGDARITVWPGPLPASAGGERVKSGSFIPVTAPDPERG